MKRMWCIGLSLFLTNCVLQASPPEKQKPQTIQGELKAGDGLDAVRKTSFCNVYAQELTKATTYQIELASSEFDSFLRIEDANKKQLAYNDDGGGYLHSRIVFTPKETAKYRIIVTTFAAKEKGKYTLTIRPIVGRLADFFKLKGELSEQGQKLADQYDKTEDAKVQDKIVKQFLELRTTYAKKALNLAKTDPKTAEAPEISAWVFTSTVNTPTANELTSDALDLMVEHHSKSPQILQIARSLSGFKTAAAAKHLRTIIEKSNNNILRAQAQLSLSHVLRNQYEEAYIQKRADDAKKLAAEAESILHQITKDLPAAKAQVDEALFHLTKLSVGKTAMNIEGQDLGGTKFKLSDYRGKIVVLSFWGSWCGPCRAMFPHERKLVQRLAKEPFALLGVNSDKDKVTLQKTIAAEKISWRSWWNGGSAEGPISTAWKVRAWPTTYILDANGIIRFRNLRGEALDSAVDALLEEMKSKVSK